MIKATTAADPSTDARPAAVQVSVGADDATPLPASVSASLPRAQRVALVDKAYKEFFDRVEAGEALDVETYCAQFPEVQSALHGLLRFHFVLEDHSALLRQREPVAWPVRPREPVNWPAPGADFLDFHLLSELGQGGFSRVYLATEGKLGDRLVAVKVAQIAQRGVAEARILGRISHPFIVPVFSVHEDQATRFSLVCMPYVGSATLADVLDLVRSQQRAPAGARIILDAAGDLPEQLDPTAHPHKPDPILEKGTYLDGVRLLGACMAEALAYVHELGICHRDLKPSNVLLSPSGVPMLLDFNLAADFREGIAPFGGTIPYMAPEQLRSMKDGAATDARADLFALGVILYELATGQHPFGPIPVKMSIEPFRQELLERQARGAVPACALNPDIDQRLSDLIQSCLAVDPQARPQSAADIARALRRELTRPARSRRWLKSNPWKALATSLTFLAITVATTVAVATRPSAAERHLGTALELCDSGRFPDALPHLHAALRADPRNAKALFARACAHMHVGEFAVAREDFLAADAIAPDGRNMAGVAYCYQHEDKSKAALDYYVKAIAEGFAPAEVHNNLGFCYRKMNQPEEARRSLDDAVKLHPRLQAAYLNRAMVARTQVTRDLQIVKRQLERPDLMTKIAPAQLRSAPEILACLEAGLADIQKALEVGPASADLHLEAAKLHALGVHFEKGRAEHALKELEAAHQQGFRLTKSQKDAEFALLRTEPRFLGLIDKTPVHMYISTHLVVNPIRSLTD